MKMKKIIILLILINFSGLVFGARKLDLPTKIEEEAVDNELRAKVAIVKEILQGKIEKKEEKKPEDKTTSELKPEEKVEKKDEIFPEVKKINDDLYVGKVQSGSGIFYIAMERINSENIRDWLKYISRQKRFNPLKYLPNDDGSGHFEKVLRDYESKKISPKNELWVAYASRAPITGKANLFNDHNEINRDIEMFVTVITSPEALITSHMEISRTLEAAIDLENNWRIKHPDQSIHLHSFAAKVMKKIDPRKKYMLTAPAIAMRNILINKMPSNTLFVGDSIYQKEVEDAQKDPKSLLGSYDLKIRKGETEEGREARLKRAAQSRYDYLGVKEKIPLLKSHPSRIIRTKDGKKQKFVIQKIDGSPLVDFDESTKQYQWMFTESYEDSSLLPYVLIDLDALAAARDLVPE